jgi:single-strand DNA-binding protein
MANDNSVYVIGNCTRDPELRYTSGGQAVASFGLAYNKRKRSADGTWEDGDPAFFDVTCWGKLAENVSESIQKGNRVVVTGRLDQRSWENQEGEKRSKVEIVADEVCPSLRWATAEISRNERDSGGGGGRGSAGSSGGGGGGGYDDDEEPF